jgi:DNA-binding HxlR family transcriptional regulator
MLKSSELVDTLCPVARSTAIVGDRWTILIIRELFMGCSRFDDLQGQTAATAQMLAARLKRLQADGLIERRVYSRRPVRHEYLLTRMGREFYPVILAFRAWGEKWCNSAGEPLAIRMMHRKCGGELSLDGACPACHEAVAGSDMDAHPTPEYLDERRRRQESFRAQPRRAMGSQSDVGFPVLELYSKGDTSVRTTRSLRRKGEPNGRRLDRMLDIALEDTFPCSDPISSLRFDS